MFIPKNWMLHAVPSAFEKQGTLRTIGVIFFLP